MYVEGWKISSGRVWFNWLFVNRSDAQKNGFCKRKHWRRQKLGKIEGKKRMATLEETFVTEADK